MARRTSPTPCHETSSDDFGGLDYRMSVHHILPHVDEHTVENYEVVRAYYGA